MFHREFQNDARYVDMSTLVKNWDSVVTSLKTFPDSLRCFRFSEAIVEDHHTPHIDFFFIDRSTETLIAHLGAVECICKAIGIEYPQKSIAIRLESIKRADVHLRDIPLTRCSQDMAQRVFLQAQSIETIRKHLSGSPESEFVGCCLDVEHDFQTARYSALMLM